MAASAFAGTTFRATKSSQFLNGLLARASTMALARCGPIFGSVSSSVALAVFRLIFLTTGAVAAGVGVVFAGAATAGAAGCAGAATCARAGAALSARNAATESRRRRFIGVVLGDPGRNFQRCAVAGVRHTSTTPHSICRRRVRQ